MSHETPISYDQASDIAQVLILRLTRVLKFLRESSPLDVISISDELNLAATEAREVIQFPNRVLSKDATSLSRESAIMLVEGAISTLVRTFHSFAAAYPGKSPAEKFILRPILSTIISVDKIVTSQPFSDSERWKKARQA